MNKFFYPTDERMVAISGKIAIVFLVFTQMALLGSILYRRYGLDQSEVDYVDLRMILLISVFGYIATRLYFGAVLPKLSIRKLVNIYFGLVVVLFVVLSIWLGLPSLDNWTNTLLPVLLGPAILVGLYWFFAYWGNRRLEKTFTED